MSSTDTALLMEDDSGGKLAEFIARAGFIPVVINNITEAVRRLRHGDFKIIFFNRSRTEIDPLEFVLNVREEKKNIPIVMVGETRDEFDDRVLKNRSRVYLMKSMAESLENEISNIVQKIKNE